MKKFVRIFAITAIIGAMSCGGGEKGTDAAKSDQKMDAPEPTTPAAPDGEKIFKTYCIACHGLDGKLALNGAKDLSVSAITMEDRIQQITKGKGLMTPYESILSPEQIQAVADYTVTLKQ